VAKELGVCATVLKKICRRNGIPRWPHRKIKSLDKMIATLEASQPKTSEDQDRIAHEVANLKNKKRFLVQNPNVLVKTKKKANAAPRRKRLRIEKTDERGVFVRDQKSLSRARLVQLADTPTHPLAAALLLAYSRTGTALRIPSPCWPPSPELGATLLLQRQGSLLPNEVSPSAMQLPELRISTNGLDTCAPSISTPPVLLEPSSFAG